MAFNAVSELAKTATPQPKPLMDSETSTPALLKPSRK
jgi:hypothetical protein